MFDGRRHNSTNYIYPYHTHPRAPCTGIVLGRALQNAYAKCQLESALVLSQAWNFYGPDPANHFTGNIGPLLLATSLTPITEGVKVLDGTHLVCRAQFYDFGASETLEVRHRLVVTGNAETATGETLVERLEATESEGRNAAVRARTEKMAQSYGSLREAVFEVELHPDQIGYDCVIQVQACATNTAGTEARTYYPALVVVHQEVR